MKIRKFIGLKDDALIFKDSHFTSIKHTPSYKTEWFEWIDSFDLDVKIDFCCRKDLGENHE